MILAALTAWLAPSHCPAFVLRRPPERVPAADAPAEASDVAATHGAETETPIGSLVLTLPPARTRAKI